MRSHPLSTRLLTAGLAAAACVLLAPAPAQAQGRRGRRDRNADEEEAAKGPARWRPSSCSATARSRT